MSGIEKAKIRGRLKITYEALEILLGLNKESIRTIDNNQIEETISIYHSDLDDTIGGYALAESTHQVTKTIQRDDISRIREYEVKP